MTMIMIVPMSMVWVVLVRAVGHVCSLVLPDEPSSLPTWITSLPKASTLHTHSATKAQRPALMTTVSRQPTTAYTHRKAPANGNTLAGSTGEPFWSDDEGNTSRTFRPTIEKAVRARCGRCGLQFVNLAPCQFAI